jgi:DNA polymerase-3 subunit alpha
MSSSSTSVGASEKQPFVHLHAHSQYSFLDGAIKVKDLVKRSKEQGVDAVALTDHGNMFGAISFYKACKEAQLKAILGCELSVAWGARARERRAQGSGDGAGAAPRRAREK